MPLDRSFKWFVWTSSMKCIWSLHRTVAAGIITDLTASRWGYRRDCFAHPHHLDWNLQGPQARNGFTSPYWTLPESVAKSARLCSFVVATKRHLCRLLPAYLTLKMMKVCYLFSSLSSPPETRVWPSLVKLADLILLSAKLQRQASFSGLKIVWTFLLEMCHLFQNYSFVWSSYCF